MKKFKPRPKPPGGYPKNNFKAAPWDIYTNKDGSARYIQRKPKRR